MNSVNIPGPSGINKINSNLSGPSDINQNKVTMPGPSGINQNNATMPGPSSTNKPKIDENSVDPTADNMYVLCPHSERDAADLHYEIHPLNGQPIKCYSARVVTDWADGENTIKEYNEFFDFSKNQTIKTESMNEKLQKIQTPKQRKTRMTTERTIFLLERYAEEAKQLLKIEEFLARTD